ncbi:BTAD domain-containing putative transcriptional regulator [Nonomuraea soli]|uniref:ATP/maltotriose-dependent transcriptional regulator MalT/DNA-binding SARP family transcriptional activator n=1 Tax=Nonomuraea soli TaxID=1032476 RepID=A0A7W0CIU6_9ACTN|nr:BTAD domain-containing putative transcriptional regulator [Nonomuraea soli]MBA2891725.1 ATP/maltotriose-dependent transcriptional regulator MalT/DNA-binding SARP family transcriptional activator [Nonomuraea soli]
MDRRLDGALTHRLTSVVAATGYGKSILLASWARAVDGVLHTLGPSDREPAVLAGAVTAALVVRVPELPVELRRAMDSPLGPEADETARAAALAGALTEALAARLRSGVALVLDGIDVLAGAPGSLRFVETLIRSAPRHLHVVTASRAPLPFPTARLRQEHEVLDFDATDLALAPQETAEWARSRLGPQGEGIAATVHQACGGWPAAVRAALDALERTDAGQWRQKAGSLAATSQALSRLTLDAFEDLPEPTRELLRAATVLPVLSEELAEALDAPRETLRDLITRGLFLEAGDDAHRDGRHDHRLSLTARHVLTRYAPLSQEEAHGVAAVAARWYVQQDRPEHALKAAVATGHTMLVRSLLGAHGLRLAERSDDLLGALAMLPERIRDSPEMARLAGIAEQNRGNWARARDLLARTADSPAFDSAVARRLGLIDYLRADFDAAFETYVRGAEYGMPPADAAMCAAGAASVLWMRGDRKGCGELADRAMEQASALGDPAALATAHTVMAMIAALDGDRRANDAHYVRALEHAERAGDIVQQVRIRSNRSSRHLDEAAFEQAIEETEIAARLAELIGFAPFSALTVSNRAKALIGVGRLEEAAVLAADAVARWEALGSRLIAYGLLQMAQLQALRGDRRTAIATYRRVLAELEESGEVQGLVIALDALAVLLADDEPEEAARLSERALRHGDGMSAVSARLAAARVALAAGRRDDAAAFVEEAEPLAVRRRDYAAQAELVGLRAELGEDLALAEEAVRRWNALGDPIGLARAELVRAGLSPPESGRAQAERVRARMHAIGCRSLDPVVDALLAGAGPGDQAAVVVETLGTFRVLRGSTPVPRTAWQSRKARDLLKILVSGRGRPMARERLVEILWPELAEIDGQAAGLRRLNVMVSTLRAVLDPGHERPADAMVVSEGGALSLDLGNLQVDVLRFLDLTNEAVRLEQAGNRAEAVKAWEAAEASYTGEFCAEDPYADWAAALREQARLAYMQGAARLAEHSTGQGRYDEAARYWLRLLEREGYDERAHLGLVRALDQAGRRGDARRRYHLYTERMRELEVEPAPYPT